MTIGVTAIIVIMTMEAKMSRVMVDRERILMRRLDLMLTVQFLLSWVSILNYNLKI